MEENLPVHKEGAPDEISFQQVLHQINWLWNYFFSKWFYFLIAGILGGTLGLGYYYIQTPKYTAECSFVLDEKSGSSGGLSSIASSFGIDISGLLGAGGGLYAYDNLLDILHSRRIIENVLLSEVDTAKISHQTLADLYLQFNNLNKAYAKKERTAGVHFNNYTSRDQFSPVQDSILCVIFSNIVITNLFADRVNKKTQIFKVSITAKNERFCKLMAERMVEEAKLFYINIKTGTIQKNVDRLQHKADSILAILNNRSYETALSLVPNANIALNTVNVPAKLAGRNETILATLYSEIIRNLETAKTTLMLQTPVIQVLDVPRYPLVNKKKGRLILIVMFGIFGGAVLFVSLSYRLFKRRKR